MPPVEGRPLILYLTVLHNSMGCVLGKHDESGRKEHAIYYLSKKFTNYETRYSLLEKTCCALAWAARRVRQYMLTHTTLLISKMDPIKYIFEKPALSGRISRWRMILTWASCALEKLGNFHEFAKVNLAQNTTFLLMGLKSLLETLSKAYERPIEIKLNYFLIFINYLDF